MPRDFEFPLVPGQLNRSELWVPMSLTHDELQGQGGWAFYMVGRLKPGVTPAQAQQEKQVLGVDDADDIVGIAGKDQNAINKALSCHRKPINVSDLTDTGP